MIQKLKFLPSVLALLLLCLTGAAFGQERTGAIEGTVKDPQGAVVPGVQVTVVSRGTTSGARPDATTAFNRTVVADESGFYRVTDVPPGFYTVSTAAAAGFGTATVNNVEVVLGKTTPVNISLAVSGQNVNVDITAADVSAIDPTDNKIQTNITAQVAELLPKGTNFTSLLTVAPAVRAEPASGQFQIDGASGSENTFIIDGQEVSNFRTGALNGNNNIPFQFVQEVQVKSSGFEAEFGGATGGVVNVVTRGGTNDWHGEFGISFRPNAWSGRPNKYLTNAFGDVRYVQPIRDRGVDEFPTATLSGPIIKDRMWFLLSVSPQFRNTIRNVTFINPSTGAVTGAGQFTQHQRNDYYFTRLDANITNNLRFNGSYTFNPIALRGIPPGFGEELSGVPSVNFGGGRIVSGEEFSNNRGGRQNSQNVTGGFVWTPTNKLVVNVRGGYSFLNEKLTSYGVPDPTTQTRFLCSTSGIASAIPAEAGCSFGQQTIPAIDNTLFDVSRRKTLDADASYLVNNLGGRHQFKGGYQLNALSNNVQYKVIDQVVLYFGRSINNRSGVPASVLPPTPGAIGAGLLQRFSRAGAASSRNDAFYFQDSWQPTSRLSINAGIRTEKENVPSFIPGRPSIKFSYGDKIAPRLGFAFDLTGDGRTKLFASYGQFYDRFKYELPRGSFGGEFFRRDYFEIFPGGGAFNGPTYSVANILRGQTDPFGGICPIPGQPRGATRCQFDFRIPSNAGLGIEFGEIDPNIKPFRQTEFTVGMERDMGSGYLLSSRYTHKKVDRAVEDIGFSTSAGSEAYIIGNPGFGLAAETAKAFGFVPLKAERKYDAVEVRLDKRFTRRYYFNANYTWSRLFGNYSGLASADEAGRLSPNVNRFFDLPFIGFTAQGKPDNGRLPTDRPHAFKFYGAYTLDWAEQLHMGHNNSTEFSLFQTIESGTPLTTRFTFLNVDNQILNGRGDLGRTEAFSQTDIAIRHKYRFGANEKLALVFDVDVLNLFNERNVLFVFENIQPGVNVGAAALGVADAPAAEARFQQTSTVSAINAFINANGGIDPRYKQPTTFQGGRSIRFGFRFLF